MNTIEEKIEKGKKIAEIIENIEKLKSISNELNEGIRIEIYTYTNGNIVRRNKIFDEIVWKHVDEMKIDVTKAIDSLKKELDSIVK